MITYFDGWFSGCKAVCEDWYKGNLLYINIKGYRPGSAVSRPEWEKAFLLQVKNKHHIKEYASTIVKALAEIPEKRNKWGQLVPMTMVLPKSVHTF